MPARLAPSEEELLFSFGDYLCRSLRSIQIRSDQPGQDRELEIPASLFG